MTSRGGSCIGRSPRSDRSACCRKSLIPCWSARRRSSRSSTNRHHEHRHVREVRKPAQAPRTNSSPSIPGRRKSVIDEIGVVGARPAKRLGAPPNTTGVVERIGFRSDPVQDPARGRLVIDDEDRLRIARRLGARARDVLLEGAVLLGEPEQVVERDRRTPWRSRSASRGSASCRRSASASWSRPSGPAGWRVPWPGLPRSPRCSARPAPIAGAR